MSIRSEEVNCLIYWYLQESGLFFCDSLRNRVRTLRVHLFLWKHDVGHKGGEGEGGTGSPHIALAKGARVCRIRSAYAWCAYEEGNSFLGWQRSGLCGRVLSDPPPYVRFTQAGSSKWAIFRELNVEENQMEEETVSKEIPPSKVQTMEGHTKKVFSCCWNPRSSVLATGFKHIVLQID